MIRGVEALRIRKKRKQPTFFSAIIKIILVAFILYLITINFFIFPVRVKSESMNPGISKGDIVIVCPLVYGPDIPVLSFRPGGIKEPERGEIIVVTPPYYNYDNFFISFFEPVVRFFTLQNKSLIHDADGKRLSEYSVKRIIGLPGDTIKMEHFIAYIKPKGAEDFIKEKDIIKTDYTYFIENDYFPENWQNPYPFSGNLPEVTLKTDEYFILGDNRTQSNDSSAWGPLHFSRISGKIILRYWPLNKFGTP